MKNKKLNKETIKVIKDTNKGIYIIGPFNIFDELKGALRM